MSLGAGKLSQKPIGDLLREIAGSGLTGLLRITRDKAIKAIFFESGAPVYAISNLAEEQPEQALLDTGLATEEQIEEAKRVNPNAQQLLRTLVQMNVLTDQALQRCLRDLAFNIILSMFECAEADYAFTPKLIAKHEIKLECTIIDCISSGARLSANRLDVLNSFAPPTLVVGADPRAGKIVNHVKLSSAEGYVLSCLTSPTPVGEASAFTGLSDIDTRKAVYVLLQLGLLRAERTGGGTQAAGPSVAAEPSGSLIAEKSGNLTSETSRTEETSRTQPVVTSASQAYAQPTAKPASPAISNANCSQSEIVLDLPGGAQSKSQRSDQQQESRSEPVLEQKTSNSNPALGPQGASSIEERSNGEDASNRSLAGELPPLGVKERQATSKGATSKDEWVEEINLEDDLKFLDGLHDLKHWDMERAAQRRSAQSGAPPGSQSGRAGRKTETPASPSTSVETVASSAPSRPAGASPAGLVANRTTDREHTTSPAAPESKLTHSATPPVGVQGRQGANPADVSAPVDERRVPAAKSDEEIDLGGDLDFLEGLGKEASKSGAKSKEAASPTKPSSTVQTPARVQPPPRVEPPAGTRAQSPAQPSSRVRPDSQMTPPTGAEAHTPVESGSEVRAQAPIQSSRASREPSAPTPPSRVQSQPPIERQQTPPPSSGVQPRSQVKQPAQMEQASRIQTTAAKDAPQRVKQSERVEASLHTEPSSPSKAPQRSDAAPPARAGSLRNEGQPSQGWPFGSPGESQREEGDIYEREELASLDWPFESDAEGIQSPVPTEKQQPERARPSAEASSRDGFERSGSTSPPPPLAAQGMQLDASFDKGAASARTERIPSGFTGATKPIEPGQPEPIQADFNPIESGHREMPPQAPTPPFEAPNPSSHSSGIGQIDSGPGAVTSPGSNGVFKHQGSADYFADAGYIEPQFNDIALDLSIGSTGGSTAGSTAPSAAENFFAQPVQTPIQPPVQTFSPPIPPTVQPPVQPPTRERAGSTSEPTVDTRREPGRRTERVYPPSIRTAPIQRDVVFPHATKPFVDTRREIRSDNPAPPVQQQAPVYEPQRDPLMDFGPTMEDALHEVTIKLNRITAAADLYGVLGLTKIASNGSILKAYETMTEKFAPYKSRFPDEKELVDKVDKLLAKVSEAYATLGNPDKRRIYDMPANARTGSMTVERGGSEGARSTPRPPTPIIPPIPNPIIPPDQLTSQYRPTPAANEYRPTQTNDYRSTSPNEYRPTANDYRAPANEYKSTPSNEHRPTPTNEYRPTPASEYRPTPSPPQPQPPADRPASLFDTPINTPLQTPTSRPAPIFETPISTAVPTPTERPTPINLPPIEMPVAPVNRPEMPLGPPPSSNPYESADHLFRQGKAYYERHDFHTAAHMLRQAVRLDPNRASYHYYLALTLSVLSQARQIHQHHEGCHVTCNLGGGLTRNQKVRHEAEQHLLRAAELDPSNADFKVRLGMLYKEAGIPKKAEQYFHEALLLDASNEQARIELGLQEEPTKKGPRTKLKDMMKS